MPIISTKPEKPSYLKWYDPNARCEYYDGVKGHSTENCTTLKDKVQALIDADQAKFQELIKGCQGRQDQLGAICSFILSFVNTFIFV